MISARFIKCRENDDIYHNSPNPDCCEGCPSWDDINGCWQNVRKYWDCDRIGEDGTYFSGQFEDEDEDYF